MVYIRYTMSTRGLPNMYTLSPRASSVATYQANHSLTPVVVTRTCSTVFSQLNFIIVS